MKFLKIVLFSAVVALWLHGEAVFAKENVRKCKDDGVSCNIEDFFGKRGHRGKRGKTGAPGAPGTNSSSGVVAAPVYFSGVATTNTALTFLAGAEIPLNPVTLNGFAYSGTEATSLGGGGVFEVSFGGSWQGDGDPTHHYMLVLKVDGVELNTAPAIARFDNTNAQAVEASMTIIVKSTTGKFSIANSSDSFASGAMNMPGIANTPITVAYMTVRRIS